MVANKHAFMFMFMDQAVCVGVMTHDFFPRSPRAVFRTEDGEHGRTREGIKQLDVFHSAIS